jgi:autotransporter-associated beta strand protein
MKNSMKTNPTNITGQIPLRRMVRAANPRRSKGGAMLMAACLAVLALALNATAANVTMTAGDGPSQTSWNTGLHWSSGQAPTSGNNYDTLTYILRTPAAGGPFTFAGDSLTISPGGALYSKVNPLTITVNNLTNSARVVNAVGGTTTLLGTMFVPTNGGAMDTGSGNSSATDNRTISNGMTISGSGNLTNLTTDANWPTLWPAAQGTVIYTGNNTAFTGRQIVMRNTVVVVGSQANLGGNPASFNPAQLTLDLGILRPTASFALNNPNSGITIGANGGMFDIPSGIFLTNANALAGAGTLSLTNTGTLVHSGTAASFTGTLSVGGGTLVLDAVGSLAGSNTISIGSAGTFNVTAAGITLANGQTLAGIGTVLGTVTAGSGSRISPAGAGAAGSLAIANLNLNNGATLVCDFLTTNDVIVVSGNLSPSGVTSIQLANNPNVGTYPLITVAGTLGGSAANFHVSALSTRNHSYVVTYDTSSTPKRVLLQVSSTGSAANLIWQGDVVSGINNVWDIDTASNWLNGANSDVYFDGDAVNFTDAGATNQPMLNVTVNPGAVSFNSSSNYTLAGSGAIAGVTSVSKGGTGRVTISTTNTYNGGTIITGGVLQIGTNALRALGSPSGATALATISGTGTLDLNGTILDAAYTNVVQINGNGSSATQGAIDTTAGGLTSGTPGPGIATVELLGDSTVSATANWQIGNTGQGIIGNGHTLTKIGGTSLYNYLYLRHAAASALGKLVIAGGGVLFWDHADAIGATATIVLTNGGWIDTWSPLTYNAGLTFANPIVVSDPVNGGMIANFRNVGWNQAPPDTYNGSVTLNGPLTITNVSYYGGAPNNIATFGKVTMNGNISGTGGVNAIGGTAVFLGGPTVFYGGNLVTLNGNNSYSGPTLVTNLIQLRTTTANQSGGAYDVEENGTLDVAVAPGKPTIPMSSLVLGSYVNLGGGNLSFARLTSMPSSPVIYATNLTLKASGSGYDINGILPPVAGYSVGQFPLVKYEGSIGGNGFPALALGTVPRGVTASLTNNTGNNSIDLKVDTTGIVWKGNHSSTWDISSTANWFNPVSATADTYQDGDSVVFDDTAANFNVNIVQAIQPGGITVNSTNDYTFSAVVGAGGISGSGALIKNGSGTLTISCTNNTFTGGTFIIGGTIKLADTNFVYPYGGAALNNNLGTVSVANGGTLDINGVQVPNFQTYGPDGYNVFISGSGVGGNGALVNNNTNDNDLADPGYVTLTGNATVGGLGDVNIRMGISPQLSSQSSDYTLTKVGPGQFRIRYVTAVSPNFGAVNILQGIVSYESSSVLGFGDASKPIYVGNGGGFAWGTAATSCMRTLICSNNSTIYGYNITTNVFAGPVTLVGGIVNLNANFYNGMIFSNVLSGAGGINLQYQSLATLAASNTYSGFTTVNNCNTAGGGNNGSVLRLVGNGSINNSPNITLQGITASQAYPGALDVSGRTDGTLTLVNNQTLRGDNGSYVRGNVVASSGTMITPGGPTNIQYMTISNNLTLQASSTVAVDVSLDGGATNDMIKVTGTATYAGTLQISKIGATALTNGAAFKLFSAGNYSGNFTTVSGPTGSTWSFNPINGVATVSGLTTPRPIITHIGVSGTTLTINATNGVANGQFVLLESTNLTLPRAQWTPVLTNLFDSNGNLSLSTNIINGGIPVEFYILSY